MTLGIDAAVERQVLDGLPPMPPAAMMELLNPRVLSRHLDCCASRGCEVCQATEAVTAGARGQDLIDAIVGGATKDVNTDGLALPPEAVRS